MNKFSKNSSYFLINNHNKRISDDTDLRMQAIGIGMTLICTISA